MLLFPTQLALSSIVPPRPIPPLLRSRSYVVLARQTTNPISRILHPPRLLHFTLTMSSAVASSSRSPSPNSASVRSKRSSRASSERASSSSAAATASSPVDPYYGHRETAKSAANFVSLIFSPSFALYTPFPIHFSLLVCVWGACWRAHGWRAGSTARLLRTCAGSRWHHYSLAMCCLPFLPCLSFLPSFRLRSLPSELATFYPSRRRTDRSISSLCPFSDHRPLRLPQNSPAHGRPSADARPLHRLRPSPDSAS